MESAELIAILREVKDRVRARNPQTSAVEGVPLPDLMPLVHARDAALGKVAAIGTVNPRPGGPVNAIIQGWKRFVARVLDWHVRDQVEFNRKMVTCIDASIEALNDANRTIALLSSRLKAAEEVSGEVAGQVAEEVKDIRNHWIEWRADWQRKLETNEIQFLRAVADLQGAFQHRTTLMEANFREAVRATVDRSSLEIQQRLWADLEKVRAQYEKLIYTELKVIRQRLLSLGGAGDSPALRAGESPAPPTLLDYARFEERFRGSEDYVKRGQQFYLDYFRNRRNILDLGCGRGEFLTMMREAGVPARGIDLSPESVAICREKGLDVQVGDIFEHLQGVPEESLDGIFCSQVVEHLPPDRLPEFIRLCASRLERDGQIAIETPNPECLAIFATHFYLDPTHVRPVPHPLLHFYFEEFGLGHIEVRRLSPAVETMPSLASLPEDFREAFFGGLDFAILGKKL